MNVRIVSALVLGGLLLVTACARDLARASSGAIGCPHEQIAVSEVSVGWSRMSWTAQCRAQTFFCSGEDAPVCTPALALPPVDDPATPPEPESASPPKRVEPAATPTPEEPAEPTPAESRSDAATPGEEEMTSDDPP